MKLQQLFDFLSSIKIPHASESEMQQTIEKALTQGGYQFSREHRLSDKDVIDFLVDGVGIECKVKGQPMAIHRQAERYLRHDEVEAIIIVTAKHMGTPGLYNEKPIEIVKVGKSWL